MNSARARWTALSVLCIGTLMTVLDETIVNVALPVMQRELGFTQAGVSWVINAYLLAYGGLLIFAGRLGDLIGHRRVLLIGVSVFTVASVSAGLSSNATMLVISRFAQGSGAAMITAVTLALIVTMFTDQREQARAIGFYSFTFAGGGALGLLVGGVLMQLTSWQWLFFINLPIGLLLIAFVVRQRTARVPLLALRILKDRDVAGANVVQFLVTGALYGCFFLATLLLQQVLGYAPMQMALSFVPLTVVTAIASILLAPFVTARFGERIALVLGLLVFLAGALLLSHVPVDGGYLADVLVPLLLLGLGIGTVLPPIMGLAMSGAAPDQVGVVSGLANSTGMIGGAVWTAVVASLSGAVTSTLVAAGADERVALRDGLAVGALAIAGVLGVALVVAGVVLRRRIPEEAQGSADRDRRDVPTAL